MQNEVHISYAGKCEENREALRDAFVASVQTLLQEDGGCGSEDECLVTDVEVMCGRRSRRDVLHVTRRRTRRQATTNSTTADTTTANATTAGVTGSNATDADASSTYANVRIRFRIKAVVRNKTAQTVTEKDQSRLLYSLDNIYFSIEDKISAKDYSLDVNGVPSKLVDIAILTLPKIESNCSVGEVLVTSENGAVCCKYRGVITRARTRTRTHTRSYTNKHMRTHAHTTARNSKLNVVVCIQRS